MNPKNIDRLITEALAIEAEDARETGSIGFMARALVQATLPHGRTEKLVHQRRNGDFKLTMQAGPEEGLPFGATPRLLLAWLNTEAVRTQDRHLVLGDTLSEFMGKLDMVPTGGRWGSITRLRDQASRLFACSVHCRYEGEGHVPRARFMLADGDDLWWSPNADQKTLFSSTVTLSERFYEEIVEHPVPIDLRALKTLRRSAMALDIYCWLTYRMFTLQKPTTIPWEALQAQFGAGYPDTTQGLRNFRKRLLEQLTAVLVVYPEAKVSHEKSGLRLTPSPTHVGQQRKLPF